MAVKSFDQIVFYLSTFPFTIDYIIGRIILFFIQILKNGGNVLHLAIEYGADEDIIKLVIANGVDLEAKCNHLHFTSPII